MRLTVGKNSILNFPAKIWTGMCRAPLCGDDSSHSQSQSGKRLLLASRGHPIRSPLYHGSCIDPTHQSHTLDLTSEAPILRNPVPIQLLIKDNCWQKLHFEYSRQNLNRNVQSPSMWWWLIKQPRPISKKAPPGLQRQKNHTAHHPKVLVLIKSNFSTPWTHPTMPLGPGAYLRVIYYKLITSQALWRNG